VTPTSQTRATSAGNRPHGTATSKSGGTRINAPREKTTPLAMKKTLRPMSTTRGLVGEATSRGRVPAFRSHVVATVAVRHPAATAITAFPTSRYSTWSLDPRRRPMEAKNATWAIIRRNSPKAHDQSV
jgi:hypothetical protein